MVVSAMDSRVVSKKLSDANMSMCKSSVHTLRNRLLNMRLESDESIHEYVNRICPIQRQLAFSGTIANNGDRKYALLNGMRPEFVVKKTILMETYDMSFERMVSSLEQTEDQVANMSRSLGTSNQI